MRIAQVAPLYEPVPPSGYGGTERVVAWLTEELVRRGHEVTLFASGDSRTSARLLAPYPRALRLDPERPEPIALHALELGQAFARADEFDVIHSHVDALAFPVARLVSTPVVHTLHGRLDRPYLAHVFREYREAPLVSISDQQRTPLARLDLSWIATIYHGLPLDRVPATVARSGRDYLVFLGRLSPEKRPDLAIDVARRVGLPLRILAKLDEADRDYADREVRPLLDDPLVDFVGEVTDEEKWAIVGGALCLLFPIDWPEPFGLAMIEALACGTPVVARPCGAVPEILGEDGTVGLTGDSVDDLVAAVKRVDLIDRGRCRRHVEERFSSAIMADRYEAVYRALQERPADRRRRRTA